MKTTKQRVRHNTTLSTAHKIMQDSVIYAGTNNRVYIEPARPKPRRGRVRGSARDKENELLISRGKGDAGVDFDVDISEVYYRTNHLTGRIEMYLIGNVYLDDRNSEMFTRR